MKKATISIALATYNEETNIATCLKAISWADEIIIVDGQSTDNTVPIAKKYKAKIISTPNLKMFHTMKQMAIDKCTGDWILQLDADEVVSRKLKDEIQQILAKDPQSIPQNGFWINRQNFFLTRFLKKGGQYPDPVARLYKRGQGRLPCLSVHEKTDINPPVGQLQNDLLHYADRDLPHFLAKNNRYTDLMAQKLKQQKLKINPVSLINYHLIKPATIFFQIYFRHLGIVDGLPGLIFAYYSALCPRTAFIKYQTHLRSGFVKH